jgi:hypothetical protein
LLYGALVVSFSNLADCNRMKADIGHRRCRRDPGDRSASSVECSRPSMSDAGDVASECAQTMYEAV